MQNSDSSGISIDGDSNIVAGGNIYIARQVIYQNTQEAENISQDNSCKNKDLLLDFRRSFLLLDKSIKDDEYFEKRLRGYERRVSQGYSPYSVLLDLLDDIDHWKKEYVSEYFGLINQYRAPRKIKMTVDYGMISAIIS